MPIPDNFLQRDYFLASTRQTPAPGLASRQSGRESPAAAAAARPRSQSPAHRHPQEEPTEAFPLQTLVEAARDYYWGAELHRLYQDYQVAIGQLNHIRDGNYSLQLLAYFAFFHRLDVVVLLPELTDDLRQTLGKVHKTMLRYMAENPLVIDTCHVLLDPRAKRFRMHHMQALVSDKTTFKQTNSLMFIRTERELQLLYTVDAGVKGVVVNYSEGSSEPITTSAARNIDNLADVKQLFVANGSHFGATEDGIYKIFPELALQEEAHLDKREGFNYLPTENFIVAIENNSLILFSARDATRQLAQLTLKHPIKHVSQSPRRDQTIRFAITLVTNDVEVYAFDLANQTFAQAPILVSHFMETVPVVETTLWRSFDKFAIVDITEPADKKIHSITLNAQNTASGHGFPRQGNYSQYATLLGKLHSDGVHETIECLEVRQRDISIYRDGQYLGRNRALTWDRREIKSIKGQGAFTEAVLSPDGRCLALRLKDKIALVDLYEHTPEPLFIQTTETAASADTSDA